MSVLEHDDIWHDEPVDKFSVQEPVKIGWKRPFDAKWRADMIVAEGKKSKDLLSRSQSYNILYPPKEKVETQEWTEISWKDGCAWVHEERLWGYLYPAWFRGDDTYIAVFMDNPKQKQKHEEYERQKALKAKKEGKEYTPQPAVFPNIYERVLIYLLDRHENTPLSVLTPVDVMRQTLGSGPCEYIVDLEGIALRSGSGKESHKLLAPSSCLLNSRHIFPILSRYNNSKEKKEGKPMPVNGKTHLIQTAKDLSIFLHAVHDRICEYRTFNETLLKLCMDTKQKIGNITVVQNVEALVPAMQKKLLNQLETFRKQLEDWDNKIADIVRQIEADNYDSASQLKHTTSLGEAQDITVADCRRYVKAIQEEVALTENTTSSAVAFVTAVRQMCRQILRQGHPRELLQSDRGW